MTSQTVSATPLLDALEASGVVWWDDSETAFVGKASDGVTVWLSHDRVSCEKYLSSCPNPSDW